MLFVGVARVGLELKKIFGLNLRLFHFISSRFKRQVVPKKRRQTLLQNAENNFDSSQFTTIA